MLTEMQDNSWNALTVAGTIHCIARSSWKIKISTVFMDFVVYVHEIKFYLTKLNPAPQKMSCYIVYSNALHQTVNPGMKQSVSH